MKSKDFATKPSLIIFLIRRNWLTVSFNALALSDFIHIVSLPIPANFEKFFFQKYCPWVIPESTTQNVNTSQTIESSSRVDVCASALEARQTKSKKNHRTHSKRILKYYRFDLMAAKLYENLCTDGLNPDDIVIYASTKSTAKLDPSSETRSYYIGVSLNGDWWQSFIIMRKRKTYIDSFDIEMETAVPFDYHCILFHGLKAKANLNYSKIELIEMIQRYQTNENQL